MHEKGYYKVEYGSIYNKYNTFMIDNPAIIISKSYGMILKIGDINSNIYEYYKDIVYKYEKAGTKDAADDFFFITFDRYNSTLSIDDICTLINYFNNNIGEKLIQTLLLNEEELKQKIIELQKIGF